MRNITHLEWPQIDLQRKVLWVEATQSKNRSAISIPLEDDAIAVLKDQIGKDLVRVSTFRGKPDDRAGIRSLNSAAKRAGIDKHIHPHLFRHTFASWHVMSGTILYDLMELGGWKKMESVMICAHLSSAHLQIAAANRSTIKDVFVQALKVMKSTIDRAKHRLLENKLIVETRSGRFNNPGGRCALYAVNWERIDECPGKKPRSKTYYPAATVVQAGDQCPCS